MSKNIGQCPLIQQQLNELLQSHGTQIIADIQRNEDLKNKLGCVSLSLVTPSFPDDYDDARPNLRIIVKLEDNETDVLAEEDGEWIADLFGDSLNPLWEKKFPESWTKAEDAGTYPYRREIWFQYIVSKMPRKGMEAEDFVYYV